MEKQSFQTSGSEEQIKDELFKICWATRLVGKMIAMWCYNQLGEIMTKGRCERKVWQKIYRTQKSHVKNKQIKIFFFRFRKQCCGVGARSGPAGNLVILAQSEPELERFLALGFGSGSGSKKISNIGLIY
jgi:hypothetical protein